MEGVVLLICCWSHLILIPHWGEQGLSLGPFYRWRNWCSERWSHLSKITQHRNDRPEISPRSFPPCGSAGKESSCNAGDLGSILGLGRSPGGEHGNPLQYSCLENPHGQSQTGYGPWGHTESDTTEQLSTAQWIQRGWQGITDNKYWISCGGSWNVLKLGCGNRRTTLGILNALNYVHFKWVNFMVLEI